MKYRKPSPFNWVSVMLVLVAGLLVYVTVYMWPVYSARSTVRGILLDHVPILYRANLRPDEVCRTMIEQMEQSIRNELKKAGINEKEVKLYFHHDPKVLELEAHFTARAHFPWPDKTFEFDLEPKVESDATRVDW